MAQGRQWQAVWAEGGALVLIERVLRDGVVVILELILYSDARLCTFESMFGHMRACLQAAQLGIIFAAVSELVTDQTIMQQLSDPNSNSQAYFLATTFLATAATFIPRFVGGEQPEDREQGVWTVTAELANGRVCAFCLLLVDVPLNAL